MTKRLANYPNSNMDDPQQNILVLAPQPFYQERGTPIAVRLLVEGLVRSFPSSKVDLLTYHEGEEIKYLGREHVRTKIPKFIPRFLVNNIRPGISLKKIFTDIFFTISVFQLLIKNRNNQFDVVHAIEESVFIALIVKYIFKVPYVYDMDSVLSSSVTDRWRFLSLFTWLLKALETFVIKRAVSVVAVCESLKQEAVTRGAKKVFLLPDACFQEPKSGNCKDVNLADVSSKKSSSSAAKNSDNALRKFGTLRDDLRLDAESRIALYVGNLESYQGVEVLIDGFKAVLADLEQVVLVIVGGREDDIARLKGVYSELVAAKRLIFAGKRPLSMLNSLLEEADLLVSPRINGTNTPMKVYSYMFSGTPILATHIESHTQVLSEECAVLVEPTDSGIADGLKSFFNGSLSSDKIFNLGKNAKTKATENYTPVAFRKNLLKIYKEIFSKISVNS